MADATFNTTSGQTVKRELLVAYLNTGSDSTPTWSPIGKRVGDSSIDYDFSKETSTDILGNVFTTMKKPTMTQTFDPYDLDGADTALVKLWNLAVKDQDYTALASMDVLIVHCYAGTAGTAMVAERYSACAISISGLGGEGGGSVSMPIEITYGGTRTVGTAAITSAGVVTFSPPSP